MRTFLSGRKGRRDVPGSDQERVLITFHHKEGRSRITRSRHIHRNQASNHFHFPNQPNHFPSPCLTLAWIKDWASLEIVAPSIHTEIPQLPSAWAAYQNCWNRSNSLHCSPMYCLLYYWSLRYIPSDPTFRFLNSSLWTWCDSKWSEIV